MPSPRAEKNRPDDDNRGNDGDCLRERTRELLLASLPYDVYADEQNIAIDVPPTLPTSPPSAASAASAPTLCPSLWRLYVVRQVVAFALFYVMCGLGQILQLFSCAVVAPLFGIAAHRRIIEETQIYFVEALMSVYNAASPRSRLVVSGATKDDAEWLRGATADAVPWLKLANGNNVNLSPPPVPERAIVISNHITMLDWILIWFAFYLMDRAGHIKIILKDSFKLIPVLGLGMYLFEFIFLSRQWTVDMKTLDRALDRLRETGTTPRMLLLFPEGTLLTRNRILASLEYSVKSGIPFHPYSLIPRTTGAWHIFERLRADGPGEAEPASTTPRHNSTIYTPPPPPPPPPRKAASSLPIAGGFTHVYNLTIGFSNIPPTLLPDDVVKFTRLVYVPQKDICPAFHMRLERIPIEQVPRSRTEFDKWLCAIFAEKSRLLRKITETNSWEDKPAAKEHIALDIPRLPPASMWRASVIILASVVVAVITQACVRLIYLVIKQQVIVLQT